MKVANFPARKNRRRIGASERLVQIINNPETSEENTKRAQKESAKLLALIVNPEFARTITTKKYRFAGGLRRN